MRKHFLSAPLFMVAWVLFLAPASWLGSLHAQPIPLTPPTVGGGTATVAGLTSAATTTATTSGLTQPQLISDSSFPALPTGVNQYTIVYTTTLQGGTTYLFNIPSTAVTTGSFPAIFFLDGTTGQVVPSEIIVNRFYNGSGSPDGSAQFTPPAGGGNYYVWVTTCRGSGLKTLGYTMSMDALIVSSATNPLPTPTPSTPASASGNLSAPNTFNPLGISYYADVYTVSMPTAFAAYTITMTPTAAGSAHLYLLDSNGNLLASNDNGGGANPAQINYTPWASSATPFTIVCTTNAPSSALAYALSVTMAAVVPGSLQPPLTIPTTALSCTLSAPNGYNPMGSQYYANAFPVDLTGGTPYIFTMFPKTGNCIMYLFDSNGNQVAFNNGWAYSNTSYYGNHNPSAAQIHPFKCPGTGTSTYTLVCTTSAPNTGFTYPLFVNTMLPSSAAPVLTGSITDTLIGTSTYANNSAEWTLNNYWGARPLDTSGWGTYGALANAYTINMTTTNVYTINCGAEHNAVIWILDPTDSFKRVAISANQGGPIGPGAIIAGFVPPADGPYILLYSNMYYDLSFCPLTYPLSVTSTTISSAVTPVTLNQTYPGNLSQPNANYIGGAAIEFWGGGSTVVSTYSGAFFADAYSIASPTPFVPYTITMTPTASGDAQLYVMVNGNQVAFHDNGGGTNAAQLTYVPNSTTPFTIVCTTNAPSTGLGYNLIVTAGAAVPTPTTPLSIPTTALSCTLSAPNGYNPSGPQYYANAFTVDLTGGIPYIFTMFPATGSCVMYLFDSSNAQVAYNAGWAVSNTGHYGNVNPDAAQIIGYTPPGTATTTHILVCTTDTPNTGFTYPLFANTLVPSPAAPVLAGSITDTLIGTSTYSNNPAEWSLNGVWGAGGYDSNGKSWPNGPLAAAYTINLTTTNVYSFKLVAAQGNSIIWLFDPTGTRVGICANQGSPDVPGAIIAGFVPPVDGIYILLYSNDYWGISFTPVTYTVSVTASTVSSTVTPIVLNQTYPDTLSQTNTNYPSPVVENYGGGVTTYSGAYRSNVYTIAAPATAFVPFTFTMTPTGSGDAQVYVLFNGNKVAFGDNGGGAGAAQASYIPIVSGGSGTLLIICTSSDPATTLAYNLIATTGPAVPAPTTPLTIPTTALSCTLSAPNGYNPMGLQYYANAFTVNLTGGTPYILTMFPTTGSCVMYLFDSNGNQVAFNNQWGYSNNSYFGNINTSSAQIRGYTPPGLGTSTYVLVCTTSSPNTSFTYPLFVNTMLPSNAAPVLTGSITDTLIGTSTYADNPGEPTLNGYWGAGATSEMGAGGPWPYGPLAKAYTINMTTSNVYTINLPAAQGNTIIWLFDPTLKRVAISANQGQNVTPGAMIAGYVPAVNGPHILLYSNDFYGIGFAPITYTVSVTSTTMSSSVTPIVLNQTYPGILTQPNTNHLGAIYEFFGWTSSVVSTYTGAYFANAYSISLPQAGVPYTITMLPTAPGNAQLILLKGGTQVGSTVDNGGGTSPAQITHTPSSPGTYMIICTSNVPSTTLPYQLTVGGSMGVATKTTISPGMALGGSSTVQVTVNVSAVGTATKPTGTVTLNLDGNPVGTPQALSEGAVTFSIVPGGGNHTVSASYNGDTSGGFTYFPSSCSSIPLIIGIPNVRLAPPAGNRADVLLHDLDLKPEPVIYAVERFAVRYWISSKDHQLG